MTVANYVFSYCYPKNTSNIILYNYYHSQMSVVTFWLNFKAKGINTDRKEERLKLVDSKQDLDSSDKETQNLPQSVRPGHLGSDPKDTI